MDEYFDLVDSQGKPTGKKKLRANVHRDGDWHRAVTVWVKNSKGQFLLQKRSLNKDSFPSYWNSSSGGHLKAGQSYQETALEELKEELGIIVDFSQLKLIYEYKVRQITNEKTFRNNEFVQVYLLIADYDVNKIRFQKDEVSDVKWVERWELEKIELTSSSKLEAKFLLKNGF